MPTAMVHGGSGVLLMMTTKFASQQTIKISQNYKQKTNAIKAPSLISASQISTPQNQLQKSIFTTDAPPHTTNLPKRCSTFK